VNVDHVATVRQARRAAEPDPVSAATLAELAGAQGIVVHLREDRRHTQDRDLSLLRQTVKTKLNLEMAATQEMLKIALSVKPDMVTLVPERREELTTEGGLEVQLNKENLKKYVRLLKDADITVSLFISPDLDQVKAAQIERVRNSAKLTHKLGLGVRAGHGLDYRNITWLADVAEIEEFSIGHAIVARAVLVGFERAVREMVELISWGAAWRRTGL
jgi:pyridoxine 5-phosphate synthase